MEVKVQGSTRVLILEIGEELHSSITSYAEKEQILSGSIQAIGALRDFELGYYYLDRKEYGRKKFPEICELISCSGNLSIREGKSFAHIHALLGRDDYSVIGGHLFSGIVAVTAEIILNPFPIRMERFYDEQTGLFLVKSAPGKAL